MATQRYISTSFWDDAWVQELDPSEKLFYLYLLTNPLTNIAGVYKISDRRVSFDTGHSREVVTELWRRFSRENKAVRHGEWVIIPAWPKHQRLSNDKTWKGIARILSSLPAEVYELLPSVGYDFDLSLLNRGAPPDSSYVSDDERSSAMMSDDERSSASNYSDSDFNFNSNLAESSKEEAPSADAHASSEVATVETVPQEVQGEDDELYAWLKQRFEKEQPGHRFTNYGKEGKAIKGIIAKAKAREPTDPGAFAEGMVETFAELRRRDRKFYGKQPFLPSSLNASGIWDRVLSEAYERWRDEQETEVNWEEPVF